MTIMQEPKNPEQEKKEYAMYGGIDAATAGTYALTMDTLRAGNGYNRGGEGGGGMYCNSFANQSSIQHGIANMSQKVEDQADCTRMLNKLGLDSVSASFENQTRAGQVESILKANTDSEFRGIARDNATNARIDANNTASIERDHRAEIALLKCCCEAEKTALAIEGRSNLDKLAEARAALVAKDSEITNAKLDILLARDRHHG